MGLRSYYNRNKREPLAYVALGAIGVSILYLVIMLLAGCTAMTRWQARQEQKIFLQALRYRKDPRTGICFAHLRGGGIAVVPREHCTGHR